MDLTKNYYLDPRVSQSKLKTLLIHPKLFDKVKKSNLYFEEKVYFTIGSAVDCILTRGEVTYEEEYHVSEIVNKPSDTVRSIINQVYDTVKESGEEIGKISDEKYVEIILKCCASNDYTAWKDSTRVSKICESFEYWEDLKKSENKTILSKTEKELIDKIVSSLKTNDVTSKYFKEESRHIEILYQQPLYFTYEDVECKSLLDILILDHENKTIQPVDIKTLGDYTINFPKAIKKRRYDIQAAFYTEGLKKRSKYLDYELLPFKFIVESTIEPGNPLVFTCEKSLLEIGKNGRESFVVSSDDLSIQHYIFSCNIKGFHQLIEDYKWYLENGFDNTRLVVESKGEFKVDWDGII